MRFFPFSTFLFFSLYLLLDVRVNAQSNASTVTNSAAPRAMSQQQVEVIQLSNPTILIITSSIISGTLQNTSFIHEWNFAGNDSDNYFSSSAEQPSSTMTLGIMVGR